MGIFNDYMREGRGIDKGPDERPRFIVFFDILFRKFWSLIKVNLLFVLACIPVVTIGPAIAGMTKILRIMQEKSTLLYGRTFGRPSRKISGKAMLIGIIDIVVAAIITFDLYMYTSLNSSAGAYNCTASYVYYCNNFYIY